MSNRGRGGGSCTVDLNSYHRDLQSGRAQRGLQTSFLRYSWCIVLIQQGQRTWQRSRCFSEPFTNQVHPTLKRNKIKKKRIKCPNDGRPPRPSEPSAALSVPLDTLALNPGGSERSNIRVFQFQKSRNRTLFTLVVTCSSEAESQRNRRCIDTPSRACLLSPLTLTHTCAHFKHLLPFFFMFPSPQQLLESNINQNFLHPPALCSAQLPLVAGAQ